MGNFDKEKNSSKIIETSFCINSLEIHCFIDGFENISSAILWSMFPIPKLHWAGSFIDIDLLCLLKWKLVTSLKGALGKNTLLNWSMLDFFKLSTLWGFMFNAWYVLILFCLFSYLLLTLLYFCWLETLELDFDDTDLIETDDFLKSRWQYKLFWELIL